MKPWQNKIHEIVYEADTPAGRLFDISLLWTILLSIFIVMFESVEEINDKYGPILVVLEWSITFFFSIEYVLRIISVEKPKKYIFSFYGIVDLLSILPTYLSLFIVGSQSLVIIRSLRLLRVFRILKLGNFIGEANSLVRALKSSKAKIIVFLFAVLSLTFILGTIMYLVETKESGFTSIPTSVYWAIVTLTTVGYGDIAPQSVLGQIIASIIMIIGYAVIAVPTGIVSSEFMNADKNKKIVSTQACLSCSKEGHDIDASYCKYCGSCLFTEDEL